MRIRSIKPEFWRSDTIDDLSWDTRLVFIGLWSYVDDNGVGVDKLSAIAADLFANDLANDPQVTLRRVSDALNDLGQRGVIDRYRVNGVDLLWVTGWDEHQRIDHPNKPRHPRPPSDDPSLTPENIEVSTPSSDPREGLATPSSDPREGLAPGAVEQGNRGTGDLTSTGQTSGLTGEGHDPRDPDPRDPDPFNAFWAAWPDKRKKIPAQAAFAKAAQRADPNAIIAAAAAFAADPNRVPENTPHAATWLNQDRWNDPPLLPRHGPAPPQRAGIVESTRNALAILDRMEHDHDPAGDPGHALHGRGPRPAPAAALR